MTPRLSGRRRGPSRTWSRVRGIALFLILAYAGLFGWTGRLVGQAETLFRSGRLEQAHLALLRAEFWQVRHARVQDALAVVSLARGLLEEGQRHLEAARWGPLHPAAFGEDYVLTRFLREGRFEPARLYALERSRVSSNPRLSFYLGAAETALNRLDQAERHLDAARADPAFARNAERLLSLVAKRRSSGRAEFIFDRHAVPLAAVDLGTGRPALLVADVEGIVDGPDGPRVQPHERAGRIDLTLDLAIQRAAVVALGRQKGGLVVLDVETGGLLAAASQPRVDPVDGRPPALAKAYEPGSILKMITLVAALRTGVDLKAVFPMECPGSIRLDRRTFRDWMRHKRVATVEEAVAVSCNIAFARLGDLVGENALDVELKRYGFAPAAVMAAERRTDFGFRVGRLLPEDPTRPHFSLARRAEGLDSVEITPIHAAMLAAGLARGGVAPVPHMVERRTNILGEVYQEHTAASPEIDMLSPGQVALIRRSMVASVSSPRGTARRAAIKGLHLAMKTGTSGSNPPGHDALVVGFAPSENPRIAWGLIAEAAGKAEWEGAHITRRFLEMIATRLK
ncbi:MAG: penicillin-binding transpeptidase domain-containing protein [Acidobacteriota bacterium]